MAYCKIVETSFLIHWSNQSGTKPLIHWYIIKHNKRQHNFWSEYIFLYLEIAAMCQFKVAFGEALSIIPSHKWLSSWLWDIGSINGVLSGSVALWRGHNGKEISYLGWNLCQCGREALLWLGRWLAEEICIQIKVGRFNKSKLYWYQSTGYAHFDGILQKGPYPPCLRMADRALLVGYPRFQQIYHKIY